MAVRYPVEAFFSDPVRAGASISPDGTRIAYLALLPLATLAAWISVWWSLGRSEGKPFAGAVAIFVLAFAGLSYSLYPYVVIDRLTIWEASAHPSALVFLLAGTSIVLPFILGYTFWSYRIFRGKATGGDPYG